MDGDVLAAQFEGGQAHYSPDERILLSMLDPKMRLKIEQNVIDEQGMRTMSANRARMDYVGREDSGTRETSARGTSKKSVAGSGVNPAGGFHPALIALAPIAAAGLGAAVSPLVKELGTRIGAKLWKKLGIIKGAGPYAPNARGGSVGASVGKIVDGFIGRNGARFQQMEQALQGMKPRKFYTALSDMGRSELEKLLPELGRVGPGVARRLAQSAIESYVPRGFQKWLPTYRGEDKMRDPSGSGLREELSRVSQLARPIVVYGLNKLLKDKRTGKYARTASQVFHGLDSVLREADMKDGGNPKGSGVFSKVKARSKKVLKKMINAALPSLVGMSKSAIPIAIDALLAKFGVEPGMGAEIAKELLTSAIPKADDLMLEDDDEQDDDTPVAEIQDVIETASSSCGTQQPNESGLAYKRRIRKCTQGSGQKKAAARFTVKIL